MKNLESKKTKQNKITPPKKQTHIRPKPQPECRIWKKWIAQSKKMLNLKKILDTKHIENLEEHEKTTSVNIKNRGRRRNPGQKHRRYFLFIYFSLVQKYPNCSLLSF